MTIITHSGKLMESPVSTSTQVYNNVGAWPMVA
jgi:hypothetical protein